MDLGDLFMLMNYHHLTEGGMVDINNIIMKNLQTIKYPTHTISTRHIFRRVSEQSDSPSGRLSQDCIDRLQKDRKTQPNPQSSKGHSRQQCQHRNESFQNDSDCITLSNHQNFKQSTSANPHRKANSPRNYVTKRQIETKHYDKKEPIKALRFEHGDNNQNLENSDSNIIKKQRLNNTVQQEIHDLSKDDKSKLKNKTETVCYRESECKCRENEDMHSHTKDSVKKQTCEDNQQGFNDNERSLNIQISGLKLPTGQDVNSMEKMIEKLVKAQTCFSELPESVPSTSNKLNENQATDTERLDGATQEKVQALEMVLHLIQSKIKQIVKFSKSIPGFSDLSLHDRLILMKGSKSESQMLGSVVIDSQNRTFQVSSNKKMNMDVIQSLFPKEYLEQKFVITQRLNGLNLSAREMAVLRAIIITYPDRDGLEDHTAVCRLYRKLIDCFLHVLKQDKSQNIQFRVHQIDLVLKFMRDTTLTYNHVLENLFEKTNKLNNFGLIKEFMDM